VSTPDLTEYLQRPLAAVEPALLAAVASGPIEHSMALGLSELDRLLDPAPLEAETGWCTLPDGVGYVAVRTEMALVSPAMGDWWFDWHPRDPMRYRIWHPRAHRDNSAERPPGHSGKAHWGTVHHPVEDIGTGMERMRIEFRRPTELGMSTDALDLPAVGTVVCGLAGDERRRMRHTVMFHVFLRDGEGVVLRSRFWIGAAIRPYGALGAPAERLLNNRVIRRAIIPANVPRALAAHCTEEYANLATLLPELYQRFGPGSEGTRRGSRA
jgi:phloretin hydrolase